MPSSVNHRKVIFLFCFGIISCLLSIVVHAVCIPTYHIRTHRSTDIAYAANMYSYT